MAGNTDVVLFNFDILVVAIAVVMLEEIKEIEEGGTDDVKTDEGDKIVD